MSSGLFAFVFVIMAIVIVFLGFQINDNSTRCREAKVSQQNRVMEATRDMVKAATQSHPLLKYEYILKAKMMLDEIANTHGSPASAERMLKMERGKLDSLITKVNDMYGTVQDDFMQRIIQVRPELDLPENEDAGLRTSSKKRRGKERRH